MKYRVIWHNDHACGLLPGEYESEEAANEAGDNWRHEMIAMETTARGRRAARDAYSFDVHEFEPEPVIDPEETNDPSELLRY